MAEETEASAPGKILWIGGYSVLERTNVSYVTTVKSYVHVNIKPSGENSVELNVPQFDMNVRGGMDPSSGKLAVQGPKELTLLKTSVEIALRYASATGERLHGMLVNTKNDKEFSYAITGGRIVKSGLGSSAALTVAAIACTLKSLEVKASRDRIHKLAQIAHSIATGKVGSGFDIAAACYGSIVYTRYSPELIRSLPEGFSNSELLRLVKKKWDYTLERLQFPEDFRMTFANFIGESMNTASSVGTVAGFKQSQPEKYNELIKELNQANIEAVDALKKISGGDEGATASFREAFERGRSLTKELGRLSKVGIEPDDCSALIDESEKNGALVAKLPGAGGKDSVVAISTSREDQGVLKKFWKTRKELDILRLEMGKKGFTM